MAAAAWSRSRGVAGVRATKGLFSIFTLLCLVCLSSSLTNKEKLKKLKEKIQKAQQELDMEKAMDSVKGLLKNSNGLPAGFPPLEGLIDTIKDYAEKTKTLVDGESEELGEEIEMKERKLRAMMKLINSIEEQEAEL